MSIRARIALLSIVAMLSVVAALFTQYLGIQKEVDALRAQKSAYLQAQSRSRLVHVLQKERGLSSALLANPTPGRNEELRKQYAETDATLGQMLPEWLGDLQAVRQQVTSGNTGWPEVRGFYSARISDELDAISMSVVAARSTNTIIHTAIIELALARENMGLMRATLNGIYSRGKDGLEDVTFLAAEYGKLKDHLRVFQRNLDAQEQVRVADALLVAPYDKVTGQIEEVLRRGPEATWRRSSSQWWSDSSRVIGNFKAKEDSLYASLFQSADKEIALEEQRLLRYCMTAISLGLIVALLTAFTILRILRALGVLIATLDDVVREENYAIRIPGGSPRDEFGRIGISLNKLLDFTVALLQDKEKLASTDLLTSTMNRRSFLHAAAREASRAVRYRSGFALIFVDIDLFKLINDRFGHAVGDDVLVGVVDVLRQHLREVDLLGRWGGEEFVILAPEATLEQGYQLAEKLRAAVAAAVFAGSGKITCSMGVAEWHAGESFEALCRRADAALYRAKETGRDRVCRAT